MKLNRSSGILLHPTCLPSRYGVGDIGPEAYRWVKFLDSSKTRFWQVLPLGPTGYGDSPYQCFSAFAGNHYLISPDLLLKDGLLADTDLADLPPFPNDHVDFGWMIPWKEKLLDRAYENFKSINSLKIKDEFNEFRGKHADWLPDFALFMALKSFHNGAPWVKWEPALRDREPKAINRMMVTLGNSIERQEFSQYLFFKQWLNLRNYAHKLGISIIGDAPIFVAHDSADVWSHPELFFLDTQGNPTVVAGVPPDYFSATGQLWGNPLYRWPVHKEKHYSWWLARLKTVLSTVDIIRLDHFRGFAGYWEIPNGLPTAEKGRWVPGPGEDFFKKVAEVLGELPLIAEDLGEITADVVKLRDSFDLPGMKILQFAFSNDASDKFLPHNFTPNFFAYTGTHDNDTSLGWYQNVSKKETDFALHYLGISRRAARRGVVMAMIRALWGSVALCAIAPMQDFLNLGTEARMNYPGRPSGNWSWRIRTGMLNPGLSKKIKILNTIYGRSK
jgi:4-alpha-glucanotransferase